MSRLRGRIRQRAIDRLDRLVESSERVERLDAVEGELWILRPVFEESVRGVEHAQGVLPLGRDPKPPEVDVVVIRMVRSDRFHKSGGFGHPSRPQEILDRGESRFDRRCLIGLGQRCSPAGGGRNRWYDYICKSVGPTPRVIPGSVSNAGRRIDSPAHIAPPG